MDALPLVSAQRFAPLKPSDLSRPDGAEAPRGVQCASNTGANNGTATAADMAASSPYGHDGGSAAADPLSAAIGEHVISPVIGPLRNIAPRWTVWGVWVAGMSAALAAIWP